MIDKINSLSHKKMFIIGILLIISAIVFMLVSTFIFKTDSNIFINYIYHLLNLSGFILTAIAYKKKMNNK